MGSLGTRGRSHAGAWYIAAAGALAAVIVLAWLFLHASYASAQAAPVQIRPTGNNSQVFEGGSLARIDGPLSVVRFGFDRELVVQQRQLDGSWVVAATIPFPTTDAVLVRPMFELSGEELVVQWEPGSAPFLLARNQGGTDAWGVVEELPFAGAPVFFQDGLGAFVTTSEVVIASRADGWVEQARLPAAGATNADLSGDTLVVGAPEAENARGFATGLAYVYEDLPAQGWTQTATLEHTDTRLVRWEFGAGVAVEDDVVIVGAPRESGTSAGGSVFVYEPAAAEAGWDHVVELQDPDARNTAEFGRDVALDNGLAIIGSSLGNSQRPTPQRGLLHVFRTAGEATGWSLANSFEVDDPSVADQRLQNVEFDGTSVLTVHRGTTHRGDRSGFVAVWQGDPAALVPSYLLPSGGTQTQNHGFGSRVQIDEDRALIAASTDLAYVDVVERSADGAAWRFATRLVGPSPDFFDTSATNGVHSAPEIALSGSTAVVVGRSAAYVFERDQGGAGMWGQVSSFAVREPGLATERSVALGSDTLVVGLDEYTVIHERGLGGDNNWGRAATFDGLPGKSVAVSADRIAVATGGSVHIIERTAAATEWSEVATVDGTRINAVDLDGDRLVVSSDLTNSTGVVSVHHRDRGGDGAWGQVDSFGVGAEPHAAIDGRVIAVRLTSSLQVFVEETPDSWELSETATGLGRNGTSVDISNGRVIYGNAMASRTAEGSGVGFVLEVDDATVPDPATIEIELDIDTDSGIDIPFATSLLPAPFELDDPNLDDSDDVSNMVSFDVSAGIYVFRQFKFGNFPLVSIECSDPALASISLEDSELQVTVAPGDNIECVFMNRDLTRPEPPDPPAEATEEIWVRVFEGSGRGGRRLAADPVYVAWPVEVRDLSTGEVIAEGETDDDGLARFVVAPGEYQLCVDDGPFSSFSTEVDLARGIPAVGSCRHIDARTPYAGVRFVRFKAVLVEDVRGRIFEDVDGDRRFDPEIDRVLEGVTVTLSDGGAVIPERSTSSQSDGSFRLRSFEGTHQVCVSDALVADEVIIRVGSATLTARCVDVDVIDGSPVWIRFAVQPGA